MAKQSWKQQMYEQIANSQVQQVMQQQRDQGIAQLQADFDAWQKQQNDIAQLQAEYDSWYAQNNPQPVQPIQTAPVQTVKKEEPKQEAIPSLADYRTADNLQYRQAKRDIALGKKRREDYQRQQQEEAMLSSNRVKKETTPREKINNALNKQTEDAQTNSVRDMFEVGESVPSNNIRDMFNQVPEKKTDVVKPDVIKPSDIAKAAEEEKFNEVAKIVEESAKDWAPWFTYQGSKWENPYDSMTPEQQKIVRDYVEQNKENPNLSEDDRKRLGDFLKVYAGAGAYEDYQDVTKAYNNSFSDKMQDLRAGMAGFVDFFKPAADLMAKGATKLPILNQIDLDKANEDYDAYVGNAIDKNKAAAEIGKGAGQIYSYAVTSPVVGAATAAMGIGGMGAATVNQLFQAGQDVAFDVWPEAQRMLKEEGQINWGELAKRFGTDVAMNFAMELVPSLRGVNYDYLTKTVGNNADIFKNMTQSGAYKTIPDIVSNAADAVKSATAANEVPVENVATRQMLPGMETEGAVVDDINKQFSDIMGMYQPETSAMRSIYNAEDLNNSLNEQLANALKASQADEAIESAAKAVPETPVNEVARAAGEVADNVDDVAKAMDNVSPIKTEIDDMAETVTNRIYDVGYKVDVANDEALSKSYNELLGYEEKWAKAISNSTDIAEIKQATKDLNNAISRFNTKAKKIDPSIASDIYNRKFSSMLNSFNNRLDDYYNGARRAEEAADLIVGDAGAKNTIEDMARQQVAEATNGFPKELKKLVEDRRYAAKAYNYAEGESVFSTGKRLDNIDKQIKEKYPEYASQIYDDRGYFRDDLFDVETVKNKLSKTMAEDTGIPKGTPEPESVKATYQIPDTPENAPIVPGGGNNDYVSQFRTHNEQNFNMTDEELNNKYFNTQNENFHFLKGNRADDLVNATKNLETDYEGTVQKLVNKPRDTQFTPQEVDEGFMAWNNELKAGRETGDYSKAADIMYRMTQDSHDKGAGLQAYVAWKKNSPAGVVLDANETARKMAVSKYGDKYIKNMDELTKKIDDILKNGGSLESQANQIDTLIKGLKGKGYRNGVKGADELKIALANGQLNSIVDVHDILYNANKIPNLSAKAQSDIAGIASEIYAKELTDAEKAKYINQINMILSQERNWSIKDKAIELSHILMLSGMRTHEKNIIANIGMLPQEALARKISALGQNAYALIDKDFKPTQAFHVSKGSKELAEKMFEAKGGASSIVEGLADKYTNRLADRIGATYMFGKMGKKNIAAKAGDKLLETIPGLKKVNDTAIDLGNKALKKIGSEGAYDAMDANVSVLENYRQAIYGSLSGLEDNPFVKENFVNRLASYIEAQGIKSLDDIPEEALDIARAEAVKATFKDDNAITELFSSIKKLPGIGELLFPFTKTPANLLARMIDFSPIGLARELLGVVNKNSRFARETVGETIDAISKGLGGTLTMLGAMWAYNNGLITGKKSDDANIANYMANEGWQQYSVSTKGIADYINKYLGTDIDLGDSYHDFSFMQPSTTNFITGIELWDELMDGKKISEKTLDDVFNRVKSIGGSYTDALLAQSTLQNVSELFGSQYSDDGVGGNLMQNAIEWPTRFVSGAISDTAKLSDDTRREYYSKNKPIDTMKNAVMSKLPVLSKQLPAKYDVFGNEMTRNKTKAGKWFNTLGNPTTSSYRSDDPLYDYVDNLNAESKEGDYVPVKYGRYVKLNDETKLDLDNKQYSELTRVSGETRAKLLNEVQNSAVFNNLSPDEKVSVLDSLEEVAKYEGFNAVTDKAKITEKTQKVVDMYKEGGVDAVIKDYVGKQLVKNAGVSSNSKAAKEAKAAVANGNMDQANNILNAETEMKTAITNAGLEVNNATKSIYQSDGSEGLKTWSSMASNGLTDKRAYDVYKSALGSSDPIPKLDKWISTYKTIDSLSKPNGHVDQTEFKAYLNKGNYTIEQAEELARIYGDWTTKPFINKKGQWSFH